MIIGRKYVILVGRIGTEAIRANNSKILSDFIPVKGVKWINYSRIVVNNSTMLNIKFVHIEHLAPECLPDKMDVSGASQRDVQEIWQHFTKINYTLGCDLVSVFQAIAKSSAVRAVQRKARKDILQASEDNP